MSDLIAFLLLILITYIITYFLHKSNYDVSLKNNFYIFLALTGFLMFISPSKLPWYVGLSFLLISVFFLVKSNEHNELEPDKNDDNLATYLSKSTKHSQR